MRTYAYNLTTDYHNIKQCGNIHFEITCPEKPLLVRVRGNYHHINHNANTFSG